jgi:GNAT superfamily N-acetyltransferase
MAVSPAQVKYRSARPLRGVSLFDIVPERFHLAADDYEELWDVILEHPSPEKSLDGDPYQPYRARYRQKHAAFPGVGTGTLGPSTTGDSGMRHEDLEAPPGPTPQVDFIPYEPGTRCSYCNINPAEITVNGAALCLQDAEQHGGVPVDEAAQDAGVEDPLSSDEPIEGGPVEQLQRNGAAYQGDHFFIFHQANPKSMGGSSSHLLEAWDQDYPLAHVNPRDRVKTVSQQLGRDAMGNDMSEAGMNHLVGRIGWKAKTGEISKVEVHPTARRQGLATELLRRAKDIAAGTRGVKPPRHSTNRTNEGEAWARSLNQRLPRRDPAMVPEHTARWVDVRNKAKRLRADNAVHLLEVPTPDSPYVFAEVQGDTALHHCFVAVKGDEQGQWSCSCNWGDFGPNGPLADDRSPTSPYKKTPCSHVLATRWELQSRSMFGRNPYTGALKEGSMDILDAWFMGRFLHEAVAPAAELTHAPGDYSHLPGWLAPHRNPEGSEWSTKTMSGTYGRNPRATQFDDLDGDTQKKVRTNIHTALAQALSIPNASVPGGKDNPLPAKRYRGPRTQRGIINNITNMFHSARNSDENEGTDYLGQGRKWYRQAHDQVKDWSKSYGIDHYHMNGATAALSPSTDWDSNLTMAHYHARMLGPHNADGSENNETFRMNKGHDSYQEDKEDAKNDTEDGEPGVDLDSLEGKRFRDMSDKEAYHAIKHQALRTDVVKRSSGGDMVENPDWGPSWQSSKNGQRAIKIMRGGDPDHYLKGHKVRSFHNNIYHPGHTDDVTVDSHASSLAVGAKMGATSQTLKKLLEFGDTNRERTRNSRGGYSYLADSYRKAHANLVASGHMDADSTPADLQAITWKRWRDLMPSRSAGKEGHTSTPHTQKNSFPVLAALDGRDDPDDEEHYDDDEHFLDPFGGPDDDELDPDLHAPEELGWEDAEEPDPDEEAHGYDELPPDDDYTDLFTDRRKEGAMYDWTNMLRQARREAQARQVQASLAPLQPQQLPVQYLAQVPHHLSSGYDEFGFEPHQAIAVPSEHWEEQHSPGAPNPASTAPEGFGDNLDPNWVPGRDIGNSTYPDERLLEPGPVLTSPIRSPGFSSGYEVIIGSVHGQVYAQGGGGGSSYVPPQQTTYVQAPLDPQPPFPMVQAPSSQPVSGPLTPDGASGASQVLAEHQAGLEWLRPPGGAPSGLPEASPATSRDALLAQHQADKAQLAAGAEAFLRTGSIPVPGFEVNMDTILSMPPGSLAGMEHDARSRDFTPAEQDEMVREGELEGAKASNLHMLRLEGSMYEELERQLGGDDQSQAAANAFWW